MKLYFAGNGFNKLLVDNNVEKLCSYHYLEQVLDYWKKSDNKKIFLDYLQIPKIRPN